MALDQFDVVVPYICVIVGTLDSLAGIMVAIPAFLGNGCRRVALDVFAEEFYRYYSYCIDICFVFPSILAPPQVHCEAVLNGS